MVLRFHTAWPPGSLSPPSRLHARVGGRLLTPENIGEAFRSAGVPEDVDYVSIDVDSIDVWLLHGLLSSGYRPRVLSVEFNRNFNADMLATHEKNWHVWTRHSARSAREIRHS